MRAATALLACPVAVAATWLLGYDVRTRVLVGGLILAWLPQYLGLSFGWVFRAHERMDRDALLNVALKLATLVLSIACLVLGARLPGVTAGLVCGWMPDPGDRHCHVPSFHLPALSVTGTTARMLLRDGGPILAMSVAAAVQHVLNTNILYKLASPTVVGWFGASFTIAGTLLAPGTVLGAAMYPRLSTAAGDAAAFRRTFDQAFRPLLLLAVLGAVGTYLFADVPVALIYSLEKFRPAADGLRAFAPVLLLIYIDVLLSMAILATGRSGGLAIAKTASTVLTTGLVFVLVPPCQERFANGGLGVMYALAGGEVLMFAACMLLLREVVDGRMAGDMLRSLAAGAGTLLLFSLLPAFTPLLGIPLCMLVFGGLSLLVGAVKRSEVAALLASFRR